MPFFDFSGNTTEYHVFGEDGSNRPILFFHANGYSALTYRPIFDRLASEGFPVYALNFWGHAKSEGNPHFEDWFLFRDQIIAFIDHIGLSDIHLIGHSLGGATAFLAAAHEGRSQRRASSVIGLDPTILSPLIARLLPFFTNHRADSARDRRSEFKSLEVVRRSYRMHPGFKNWHDECFQGYLESAFYKTESGMFRLCLEPKIEEKIFRTLRPGHWTEYRTLRIPICILAANPSEVTPKPAISKLVRKNPKSDWHLHNSSSHFFPMEDPEWTANQILKFLRRI